jgi:hypothetical protein
MVKYINTNIDTSANSLEFLDKETASLAIETLPDKNNKNVVETVLVFMDELFTNIVMKDYFENIKKNK